MARSSIAAVELFLLVDTRSVWLDLRVAAEEAALVKTRTNESISCPMVNASRTADESLGSAAMWIRKRERCASAPSLPTPSRTLRNESFGRGQIVLRDEADAIVVPESAIQWDGGGQIVFVRDAQFFKQGRPKFFVSRSVRTGVKQNGFAEIIAGVLPGEVVATTAAMC